MFRSEAIKSIESAEREEIYSLKRKIKKLQWRENDFTAAF